MRKVNFKDTKGESPSGTVGVDFRQLIAKDMRPPNFYMRLFEIAPGGHTPKHSHSWEHEVFIVKGEGEIVLDGREEKLAEGDAVFVEPNELHQFVNSSQSVLRLICVIPKPPGD
jgi:quercetin dioxygenase-like cupin family protein